MANPVSIGLDKDGPWVLVAEDILSATIHIVKDTGRPSNYEKTYVLTGDPAPVGDIDESTRVIELIISIAHSEPIDVYMRYIGDALTGGRIVVEK